MTDFRMRPRFDVPLSIMSEEGLKRFKEALNKEDCIYNGQFRKNHVILHINPSEKHLWSPFLDMEFVEDENQKGATVHGVIGPSPEVWTAFMAGHFGILFLVFVASVLGYSQWSLEQKPWGWYGLPILLLLSVLWYSLSLFGKKMASPQMEGLCDFFEEALSEAILPSEKPCEQSGMVDLSQKKRVEVSGSK